MAPQHANIDVRFVRHQNVGVKRLSYSLSMSAKAGRSRQVLVRQAVDASGDTAGRTRRLHEPTGRRTIDSPRDRHRSHLDQVGRLLAVASTSTSA